MPERTDDLADPALARADRVLELALGRWDRNPAALLNTDEHPRVEFLAPLSHLDRRLLSRQNFRKYFDRVLAKLPSAFDRPNKVGPTEAATNKNAARQRVILFGK